ncbi:MAG: hypothetical protein ACTSSA_14230 [Candidatus Freyarchaeota archaeon]
MAETLEPFEAAEFQEAVCEKRAFVRLDVLEDLEFLVRLGGGWNLRFEA